MSARGPGDELKKLAAVGLAAAAGFTVIVVLVPKLLGAAAGAEVEIITALKAAEASGFTLEVGAAEPLRSTRVNFQRISVAVSGSTAVVSATLDFDGRVKDTQVSSLGLERVPFVLDGSEWVPQTSFAPQLQGVVRALEKRRAALEAGEPWRLCSGRSDGGESAELAALLAVQQRRLRVLAWLMRSEREGVVVSEQARVVGRLPSRPVDDVGLRRLVLQAAPDGEFCFPDGLM